VKVRALLSLATAAGLSAPAALFAQQHAAPAPLPASAVNPNQLLADAVAYRLREANVTAGADVSIVAQEGTVILAGTARDAGQKARIIAEVRQVGGVVLIRDRIVPASAAVVQVQNPPVAPAPVPIAPPMGIPGNPIVEPAPLGAPGQMTPDLQAPPLPPYSWPTYAPYNNVSRVAYPQAYPYNAFPFIGPYYPFPKVPLGWRKVVLEWEDGHWYLGRASAPHDYWRVRFW
jgi:hypothetical protein